MGGGYFAGFTVHTASYLWCRRYDGWCWWCARACLCACMCVFVCAFCVCVCGVKRFELWVGWWVGGIPLKDINEHPWEVVFLE